METIEIELPIETIAEVALEAHKLDITLNEYIMMAIEKYLLQMVEGKPELELGEEGFYKKLREKYPNEQ